MAKKKLILNRYRPLGKAGEGGFSTVVAAFDTHLKRKVAIKVIELDAFTAQELAWSMGLVDDEDEWDGAAEDEMGGDAANAAYADEADEADDESFDSGDLPDATPSRLLVPDDDMAANLPGLSEAQVAGNLGSPHIVSVYDLVLEGTTAYLIMEYVDGTSLADFLQTRDDDLTLNIVAAVVDGVANALEVAHRHNVLHLDIKPGNIMIDKQGQVKVTDFGMAAVPDAQGIRHGEGGTIGYMPPEQMNREPLDERCDEWALASVTYQMLAGENPFDAPDLDQAQDAIRHAELVLPSLMWADLDEQADDVLFYALDPNREERYDTVSDFAEEMVPLLGSPRQGKAELAQLMAPPEEDEPDAEPARPQRESAQPSVPLRERLTPRAANIAGRAFSLVMTALIMGFSVANMPLGDTTIAAIAGVIVAACSAASAVFPVVGPLVAYAALSFALMLNAETIPGVVLLVATIAWWVFAARPRTAKSASNIALATPLCGAIGLGPLASLAAGYYLTVGKAAATAAHSVIVAVILGSLGARSLMAWDPVSHVFFAGSVINATDGMLYLVQQPWVWALAISWIVAAVALSLCCSRGMRALAIVGGVDAGIVLVVGLAVARNLSTMGMELMPSAFDIGSVVVCTIIVVICSAITVPGTPD